MEPFYKAISECCDYAAEKGVLITLKPHGQVGAFCLEQVKKVNHKNFKLWYDPGNVFHAFSVRQILWMMLLAWEDMLLAWQ